MASNEETEALYENWETKAWVKRIPFEKAILWDDYPHKHLFVPAMEVHLDPDACRNTVLKFEPLVEKEIYKRKTEWIYILTMNDAIVKIGGTRSGLKDRAASYLCGHHTRDRGRSGDCSKTNAFVYNTMEFYLHLGFRIRFYAYELPLKTIEIEVLGELRTIHTQTYHAYESIFMEDYKKQTGAFPFLSMNADPSFRQPKA